MNRLLVAIVTAVLLTTPSAGRAVADDRPTTAGASLDDLPVSTWSAIDPAPFYPPGLAHSMPGDLEGVSLQQVCQLLTKMTGLKVVLDADGLRDSGVGLEEKITKRVAGLPIYLALDRILGDVDGKELAWLVEDGRLMITSLENAFGHGRVTTLDISALLDIGYTAETLKKLSFDMTSGPWHEIDGDGGSVAVVGDRLTVRHSDRNIREIQILLAALASTKPVIDLSMTPADEKARDALNRPVTLNRFNGELTDALKELSSQAGVIIELDLKAVEDVIGLDQVIGLNLANRPLREVLHQLFQKVEEDSLEVLHQDGVLVVTSLESCDRIRVSRIYHIPEIAAGGDSEDLADLLMEMTSGPWQEIDGDGGRISIPRPATLIVSQAERGHQEIEKLVAAHRSGTIRSTPRADAIEIRRYRLPAQMAEDLLTTLPRFVAPDQWKDFPDGTSPLIERVSLGNKEAAVDEESVEVAEPKPAAPQTTKEAGATRSGEAVLLIRQTTKVHRKISRFIDELQSTRPPHAGFF